MRVALLVKGHNSAVHCMYVNFWEKVLSEQSPREDINYLNTLVLTRERKMRGSAGSNTGTVMWTTLHFYIFQNIKQKKEVKIQWQRYVGKVLPTASKH